MRCPFCNIWIMDSVVGYVVGHKVVAGRGRREQPSGKKIDVVDIHFVELQRCSSGFKISDVRKFCSGAKLIYYFRQSGRQAILRYHTYSRIMILHIRLARVLASKTIAD